MENVKLANTIIWPVQLFRAAIYMARDQSRQTDLRLYQHGEYSTEQSNLPTAVFLCRYRLVTRADAWAATLHFHFLITTLIVTSK